MRQSTRTGMLLISFILTTRSLFAQPANDNCAAAQLLTSGTPFASTVWAATATGGIPVGCAVGNPDDDVWFRFVATASGIASIKLTIPGGSDLTASGAMIQLFSGACGGLASVSCANGALDPLVVNGLTNGNTYYVRVYSYATGALSSSAASDFSITFTNFLVPSNDECADAILLPTSTVAINSFGRLQAATTSTQLNVCAGTVKYDTWYKFVAKKATATINLSNPGTNISGNVRLQLLSGICGGTMTSLFCSTSPLAASSLTIGATYYIRVYSNTASGTTFTSNADYNINVVNPGPVVTSDSTISLFNMDTVAKNLGYPWEITHGPDDSLWITEARGYRVLRISSSRTQAKINVPPQQVLKLTFGGNGNPNPTFSRSIGTWPQGGMEGLAIRPDWDKNDTSTLYVYLAYVYKGTCAASPPSGTPCIFRSKIVRCRFYFSNDPGNPSSLPKVDTLVIRDTVISNLPGSNDHNSGRLKFGPFREGLDNDYKLYFTIGDMGAGQFNNDTRVNYAQNKDTLEGKILRLNSKPDGDASFGITHEFNSWREWIPNDNPFTHSLFPTLRTPVFSYGHRNAQGLAWGNVGGWKLYSSEHGDRAGDEVNLVSSGMNYGWPKVTGDADDNYTTYDNLTDGFTINDVLANQSISDEQTFSLNNSNFVKPVFDFFNWTPAMLQVLNTGNIFTWPTIAPSSIDFYSGNIPGWKNSLLVTSLKYGLYRLKLNSAGTGIDSTATTNDADTLPLLHGWRIRDIAINPIGNSGQFWAITDSTGSTSGPTGGFGGSSQPTANGGRVLRLTFKTLLTLPVEFVSFKGRLLTDRTIRLDWETSVSDDHLYFDVEKSLTNSTFTAIGRVTTGAPYKFIDVSPNIGNNYYRIKETTTSGKIVYSKIINVVYNLSPFMVSLYPNPVTENLNLKISALKADDVNIRVSDVQGRVIYKKDLHAVSGMNDVQINAKNWAPGLYTLKVTGSNNQVITVEKFIRQ